MMIRNGLIQVLSWFNRGVKKALGVPRASIPMERGYIDAELLSPPRAAYSEDFREGSFVFVLQHAAQGSGGLADILSLGQELGKRFNLSVSYWNVGGQSRDATYANIKAMAPDVGSEQVLEAVDFTPHYLCATAWPTAYKTLAIPSKKKLYFVQDYEPLFHSAGIEHHYARQTYELGLEMITLGPWLAEHIRQQHNPPRIEAMPFPATESSVDLEPLSGRPYITFYLQPDKPHRGSELLLQVARQVARNVQAKGLPYEVVLFGSADNEYLDIDFPARVHGVLSDAELERTLKKTRVGVCASFTNVSLLTFRLMAHGCAAVDLDLPNVRVNLHQDADVLMMLSAPTIEAMVDCVLQQVTAEIDEERRERLVHDLVKQHAWSVCADAMAGFLETKSVEVER